MSFHKNRLSDCCTFRTSGNEICLTFYVSGPIWINVGTGDAHKNLSGYRFQNKRRNDSKGMNINCDQYLSYFWPDVGEIWRNVILIYIQQATTLHILFYLETALHISGCTSTHHQERKQLYLQHLIFVTSLLLSAGVTNIRCCRYSCLRS